MPAPLQTSGFTSRVVPQFPALSPGEFVLDSALAARMGLEGRRQRLAEEGFQRELERQLQERRAEEARRALDEARIQGAFQRQDRELDLQERQMRIREEEAVERRKDDELRRKMEQQKLGMLQTEQELMKAPRRKTSVSTIFNENTGRNELVLIDVESGEVIKNLGAAPSSDVSRSTAERMLLDDARNVGVDITPFTEVQQTDRGPTLVVTDPQGLNAAVARAQRQIIENQYNLNLNRFAPREDPVSALRKLLVQPQQAQQPQQPQQQPALGARQAVEAPAQESRAQPAPARPPEPPPARTQPAQPRAMIGTAGNPFPDMSTFEKVLPALFPGKYYVLDGGQIVELTVE